MFFESLARQVGTGEEASVYQRGEHRNGRTIGWQTDVWPWQGRPVRIVMRPARLGHPFEIEILPKENRGRNGLQVLHKKMNQRHCTRGRRLGFQWLERPGALANGQVFLVAIVQEQRRDQFLCGFESGTIPEILSQNK